MKKEFLKLADKLKTGDISEKELPVEMMKLFKVEKSSKFNNEKTVNDFIIDCLSLYEERRCLPINIIAPNSMEFYPSLKMKREDNFFHGDVEKVIISF